MARVVNRHGYQVYCSNQCKAESAKREAGKRQVLIDKAITSFKCKRCGGPWSRPQLPNPFAMYCSRKCACAATRTPYHIRKNYPATLLYRKVTRKKNIQWRLAKRLRGRVRELLGNTKKISAMTLLGCSVAEFKEHLQSQFKCGMHWNNYGKWHIDHIQPCASFDLTDLEQQKKCFHFSNMRPLWANANKQKSGKITVPQLSLTL